jgi:hypothetical protein
MRKLIALFALSIIFSGATVPAAAADDPWFNPPGGNWTPDQTIVLKMKATLDASLRPVLEGKGEPTRSAARYWFQYLGKGAGISKTIFVFGRPFPIYPRASEEFFGAYIPESCHVEAIYRPDTNIIDNLVIGFGCPRLAPL